MITESMINESEINESMKKLMIYMRYKADVSPNLILLRIQTSATKIISIRSLTRDYTIATRVQSLVSPSKT